MAVAFGLKYPIEDVFHGYVNVGSMFFRVVFVGLCIVSMQDRLLVGARGRERAFVPLSVRTRQGTKRAVAKKPKMPFFEQIDDSWVCPLCYAAVTDVRLLRYLSCGHVTCAVCATAQLVYRATRLSWQQMDSDDDEQDSPQQLGHHCGSCNFITSDMLVMPTIFGLCAQWPLERIRDVVEDLYRELSLQDRFLYVPMQVVEQRSECELREFVQKFEVDEHVEKSAFIEALRAKFDCKGKICLVYPDCAMRMYAQCDASLAEKLEHCPMHGVPVDRGELLLKTLSCLHEYCGDCSIIGRMAALGTSFDCFVDGIDLYRVLYLKFGVDTKQDPFFKHLEDTFDPERRRIITQDFLAVLCPVCRAYGLLDESTAPLFRGIQWVCPCCGIGSFVAELLSELFCRALELEESDLWINPMRLLGQLHISLERVDQQGVPLYSRLFRLAGSNFEHPCIKKIIEGLSREDRGTFIRPVRFYSSSLEDEIGLHTVGDYRNYKAQVDVETFEQDMYVYLSFSFKDGLIDNLRSLQSLGHSFNRCYRGMPLIYTILFGVCVAEDPSSDPLGNLSVEQRACYEYMHSCMNDVFRQAVETDNPGFIEPKAYSRLDFDHWKSMNTFLESLGKPRWLLYAARCAERAEL